jgi:hypothetical protein
VLGIGENPWPAVVTMSSMSQVLVLCTEVLLRSPLPPSTSALGENPNPCAGDVGVLMLLPFLDTPSWGCWGGWQVAMVDDGLGDASSTIIGHVSDLEVASASSVMLSYCCYDDLTGAPLFISLFFSVVVSWLVAVLVECYLARILPFPSSMDIGRLCSGVFSGEPLYLPMVRHPHS